MSMCYLMWGCGGRAKGNLPPTTGYRALKSQSSAPLAVINYTTVRGRDRQLVWSESSVCYLTVILRDDGRPLFPCYSTARLHLQETAICATIECGRG